MTGRVVSADRLRLWMTLHEVRAFLGTIDTPSEAALLAYFSGYNLDCDGPNLAIPEDGDGYLLYVEKGHTCDSNIVGSKVLVTAEGEVQVLESRVAEYGEPNCTVGRLPAGWQGHRRPHRPARAHPVGALFSRLSGLEAAAVVAFEDLAGELRHHGAPRKLVARALRAARQETRHALLMGALARRHGYPRRIPDISRQAPRPLVEVAEHNAVEGLTRETYGALVATYQAQHAADPVVRRVMRDVALEETQHASLSWALHRWCMDRLSAAERKRVLEARQRALRGFRNALQTTPVHALVREHAGMPSPEHATQLYDQLMSHCTVTA